MQNTASDTLADRLSRFVVDLSWDALPASAIERTSPTMACLAVV